VKGFYGKNGAHYVFLSDGNYREHVLIQQQTIGANDSYSLERYYLPRIFITGNPLDNTTVKAIGVTPANDNAYVTESSMRELFEVDGGIVADINGIYGLQAIHFIRTSTGANANIINSGLRNVKQGQGTGINTEQYSIVVATNCFWTNLYKVTNNGRMGGIVQFVDTLNTADSCSYLFSGGKSLVQLFSSAVLTVTGSPILQEVTSGVNGLSIEGANVISGTYSVNSSYSTGATTVDTLYAKYLNVSTGLRFNGLNSNTFPYHISDAVGLTNSGLSQTSGGNEIVVDDTVKIGSSGNGVITSAGDLTISPTGADVIVSGRLGVVSASTAAKVSILTAANDTIMTLGKSASEAYHIRRNSATGFLDIVGGQTTFSGYKWFVNSTSEAVSINNSRLVTITGTQTIKPSASTPVLNLLSVQRSSSSTPILLVDSNVVVASDSLRVGTSTPILLKKDGTITSTATIQSTTGLFTNLNALTIPYHLSDASGLTNSPITISSGGDAVTIGDTIIPTGRLLVPMGEINYFDSTLTGTSVAIVTATTGSNNYVKVAPTTALTSGAYEFDNGGSNNGRLRYTGATTKMFHIALTISALPSVTNDKFLIGISKNGVILPASRVVQTLFVAGTDIQSTALHVFTEMATNDYLEVVLGNFSGTGDISVVTMTLFAMGM